MMRFQRPKHLLQWMIVLSVGVHLVFLWVFRNTLTAPPRKRVMRVVRLYKRPPQPRVVRKQEPHQAQPRPRPRLQPRPRPIQKAKARRRPKRKRRKRVARRRTRKARPRTKETNKNRLARLGRGFRNNRPDMLREHPPERRAPEPLPRPPQKPLSSDAKSRREPKRSYRNLDLRPRALPHLAQPGKGKGRRKSGAQKGKGNQPWAGNDRFGRTMRAYHQRWKEWHRDYSGLTDAFFGTAQVSLDRCLESRFTHNLHKHLTYSQLASIKLGPKWQGKFVLTWSRKGKPKIVLQRATGYTKLNSLVATWAKRCLARITVPKHLKGKKLWMVAQTKLYAKVRAEISNLIGFSEVRDPQSGGLKWKFAPIGSVHVWSNTMFLRSRVMP